ncbi:MAG TPA: MFS transporter [Actinospica sp.]|nr:MFS transporter [Actinospica sp.]
MSVQQRTRPQGAALAERVPAAAYVNLVVATIGFALTFWSWNLVAPLAGTFQTKLGFSSFQQSALTAVPVIIGSLGRIPVGALTDRFGAKLMFPLFSALAIVPTLLLIPAKNSYWTLVLVGFVLGIGGTISDRFHPAKVTAIALGVTGLIAVVQAFDPRLNPTSTIAFLLMAAGLGTASGSVFALVARVTPQPRVGSVTGIVGAVGGLGGFVPPLVMGAIYSAKGTCSIGLMLLSDPAFAAALYSITRMRQRGNG